MNSRITKLKFHQDIVLHSWGKVALLGIGIQIGIVLIVKMFTNVNVDTEIATWLTFALLTQMLRFYIKGLRCKRNAIVVNNFRAIRVVLAVLAGVVYGLCTYLFASNLDPAGRTILYVTLFLASHIAIPILYDSTFAYLALWLFIWIPCVQFNAHRTDMPLILTLAIASMASGLFLCSVLRQVFLESLVKQERIASAATSLTEDNQQLKMLFLAANHDLSQPLTAILYAIKTLEFRIKGDIETEKSIKIMKSSCVMLSRLISDIVEFEKISSGIQDVHLVPTLLQPIFEKVVSQVEGFAEEKNLVVIAKCTDKIALAAPFLLERILRNLVENAIRNTVEGRIVIAARPRGGLISVEVWDTGVGIEPSKMSSVFDLFDQNNGAKVTKSGHGIGLTIVRTLAQKMGATIAVKSIPGHGTVFRLLVRPSNRSGDGLMAQTLTTSLAHPLMESEVTNVHKQWFGKTIAVIEDNENLRHAICGSFLSMGATVLESRSSAELLQIPALEVKNIDILVTDWNLGIETGEDAKNRLSKQDGFRAEWYVISGDIPERDKSRLVKMGVPVLIKPVDADRLLGLIHESLIGDSLLAPM